MQCEEWADANSELFKEAHDETLHKNSYKSRLYELISASLVSVTIYMYQNSSPGVRMTMRAGRQSRNADFILIARRAIPQPSAA